VFGQLYLVGWMWISCHAWDEAEVTRAQGYPGTNYIVSVIYVGSLQRGD